jgi:hypothetical protein
MLNRDPAPEKEGVSWRLSLSACLVRTCVIQKMGWLNPVFAVPEAAVLEMGHRWITYGVLMKYVPELIQPKILNGIPEGLSGGQGKRLTFEDELLFIDCRFGRKWARWTLMRSFLSGYAALPDLLKAWRKVEKGQSCFKRPEPYHRGTDWRNETVSHGAEVSVLIPTLNRYPYLRKLLEQLRKPLSRT